MIGKTELFKRADTQKCQRIRGLRTSCQSSLGQARLRHVEGNALVVDAGQILAKTCDEERFAPISPPSCNSMPRVFEWKTGILEAASKAIRSSGR